MKVALVHDFLTQRGGAERVFELICKYFPNADIFTSLYDPQNTISLDNRLVHTTQLQKIPGATKYFRLLAPFYFQAFQSLDLSDYDLIISSNSAFAKSVRKKPKAKHICLCHNITRFLWDTKVYLHEYKRYKPFSSAINAMFEPMRKRDIFYSDSPDLYVANSSIVAKRIEKIYKKKSLVINFPINTNKFTFSDQKEDYYLVASRLLSYKRIDIIVEAFNWLGLPLLIIGDGPERKRLEANALNNIHFLGHVNDQERNHLMAKARFVVVAALEDYGLVPIEANASGTPVICYGAGGVLDTQIPEKTGLFFNKQTPDALQSAIVQASQMSWDYSEIRNHAIKNFSETVFFEQVIKTIEDVYFGESISSIIKPVFMPSIGIDVGDASTDVGDASTDLASTNSELVNATQPIQKSIKIMG
jgi:glycosyltransferase involved in cell wall biosynthesis